MIPKVLVVDDEPEVRQVVKALLESVGCEVLAVADSREAAQRVSRQKFDGIFLDARMPHLNGFELTRQIRESHSNSRVPIVLLTGADDLETMRSGFNAGVTFFLGKPLDVKKLQGLLRAMRGAMLKERRRYVRLPLRIVVNCRAGRNQFKAASLNIGEGGLLLEGSGGLEVGREIDLLFSLPQNPAVLNPRAKVVRKESSDRMAVQFLELRPEELKALQNFIAGALKE